MKPFHDTDGAIVVRTDFSNDVAWTGIQEVVKQTIEDAVGGDITAVLAMFEFISDADYDGATSDELVALAPVEGEIAFLMVADSVTMTSTEHPVLVVDLGEDLGSQFRAVPSTLFDIASNLSIANMDFSEFADSVDDDGIFRGF